MISTFGHLLLKNLIDFTSYENGIRSHGGALFLGLDLCIVKEIIHDPSSHYIIVIYESR